MKVALVSIRFDTRGGSERRTYQLAAGLVNAGHDVEVFAANVLDMDLDAKVNIVPMSSGPSFMKVKSFTKNVNRMLAGRGDIDIVHNQIRPFTDGVVTVGGGCHAEYLELTGKGRGLGMFNPLHRVILGMEKNQYRQGGCRAVITNSELARTGILNYYPMPSERVFVAYNGVDLQRFSPPNASSRRDAIRKEYGLGGGPVALFLGTGFARKGLAALIKAIPSVKGMDALKLLVVGKDEPGPFRRLAQGLGVAERVVFAGTSDRPEYFYGASDIFILPTIYDPFSNATLEAMACGLPVITTAQNGVSEIITDGENGFVVDRPEDVPSIADRLSRLAEPKARWTVGENARRRAEGFSWDKTLDKTLEVYKAVAALRSKS